MDLLQQRFLNYDQYAKLVKNIASRYFKERFYIFELDEWIEILQGIDLRFDPDRGVKLGTFRIESLKRASKTKVKKTLRFSELEDQDRTRLDDMNIAYNDYSIEQIDNKDQLLSLLKNRLNQKEMELLHKYYFEKKSLRKLGEELNMNHVAVDKALKLILNKIRQGVKNV